VPAVPGGSRRRLVTGSLYLKGTSNPLYHRVGPGRARSVA